MNSFSDSIFQASTHRKTYRLWLISDLQQAEPTRAQRYFDIAIRDFQTFKANVDGICYLGDAAESADLDKLKQMIDMQVEALNAQNLPIFYVMGNHEFDYYRYCMKEKLKPTIPFYDKIKDLPNWHAVPQQEQFWFAQENADFIMLFFSDHASKDGTWVASHQAWPPFDKYPYTPQDWCAVRDKFANCGKPVFSFAHCPFPGGNRPSEFLEKMLPLPTNFRAHFYGHAHIGDEVWAGENLYRQIACVDNHPIPQFDIASLDHLRGTTVRSAIFDYYGNGAFGVFFRDHINRRWEQFFLSEHDPKSAGIPEKYQTR